LYRIKKALCLTLYSLFFYYRPSHEAAVLMEFGGSAEDLARTCHAHPTLAEAVKEAALSVAGRAIHS
jgi:hypothetical protein